MSLRQRYQGLANAVGHMAAILAYGLVPAGIWIAMSGLFGGSPGTPGALVYWAAAAALLVAGLRWIARRNSDPGRNPGAEALRIVSLAGAMGWASSHLLTMHFAGGLDARWYGYTMIDALEQARHGHWPVFVGQGEFQWNGAIHPIRSAPYLSNLAILLDVLTLRRLTPLGVQHLTLILSLVQAVVLTYILLVRCAPRARWLAWICALAWGLAPMMVAYLVAQEMFMTVMSFGWLPLVYFGNVRMIQRDDRVGQVCLACGLALTWMSHAAVALWATIITAVIQGLRLLLRDFTWPAWRRTLLFGLLFAWLGAYYFCSMAELSLAKTSDSTSALAGLFMLIAALAALIRAAVGGTWRWWLVALAGLPVLWICNRLYFNWLVALHAWTLLLRAWRRWLGAGTLRPRLPELLMAGFLVSIAVAVQFPFFMPPLDFVRGQQAAAMLSPLSPAIFMPVSPEAAQLTDLQLGFVLWAVAAAGCLLAWLRGGWEARLLCLAAAFVLGFIAPIPGLTPGLMLAVPAWLYGICSVSLWMRLLPNFSLLAVFVLFLVLAQWAPRRTAVRWLAGILFVALSACALDWDVKELSKLRRRAAASVNSAEGTEGFYREDTAQLYSYSYDNMAWPGYLINATTDYHLESRLLRAADMRIIPEPLLDAPGGEEVTLTTNPDPREPTWLRLAPSLRLAPGERMILKFSFFAKDYNGTLIFQGPRGFYRNYYLPSAGFFPKSFGVAPGNPKTLALWNRLGEPQDITAVFLVAEPRPAYGDFARIRIQRYRPEDLQIDTLGLIPYHARVKASEPVFLETPRVFIPGYRAKVDGRPVPVTPSSDVLAMVRLDPGIHDVVVAYRPTLKLLLALCVSALGWLWVGAWTFRRLKRPPVPA